MKPTISDVARLTNKNRSTVSRVLRNDKRYTISEACRKQIMEAAAKLNYVPQHSARSLATGKSYCVGALLGTPEKDLASPVASRMFLQMAHTLLRSGYHFTFLPMMPGRSARQHILDVLQQGRVDGLYVGTRMIQPDMLEDVAKHRIPMVTTDAFAEVRDSGLLTVVDRDHRPGMKQMAEALVRHGHRRVLYVISQSQVDNDRCFAHRVERFQEAAEQAGIREVDVFIYTEEIRGFFADRAEARLAVEREIDRFASYSAVVANSDLVAYGVMDALRAAGIEPGKDIAVTGGDNLETGPNYPVKEPFLATIETNMPLRGQRVAETLLERMQKPDTPVRTVRVPTTFIARPSLTSAKGAAALR
ncbi:LacI family DNA-binding transcriptional regulator [Phycisphaerales bacterium AB-hyl4]|uniref:LacI family DNA-binding transcriptional regulator n=1 Tax=Natronomicrosphaera hydrolytica TaxID=3242702 RepID=A0ABV4U7Z5_9BACT